MGMMNIQADQFWKMYERDVNKNSDDTKNKWLFYQFINLGKGGTHKYYDFNNTNTIYCNFFS